MDADAARSAATGGPSARRDDTTANGLRWLAAAPGVLEALAVNAVPLWGLMHGAWSLGTILLFYWLANFLNTFFIGARILVHRAVTHKRGHWMVDPVRTVTVTRGVQRTETRLRPTTLLANFVVTNLAFTLAHGVFVAAFVFGILKLAPSWGELRHGVLLLLTAMSTSLLVDLTQIGSKPFAWIRRRTDLVLGRMVVVHLGLIGGVFLLAMTERPASFFAVFLLLKLLFDIGTALPQLRELPSEPPRYIGWTRRLGKPGEMDAAWKAAVEAERQKLVEAEEVLAEPPGR
jgi:hypothetical protein